MTGTNSSFMPIPQARISAIRFFSSLRPQDILVLQGSPLLGAAFALRNPIAHLVPLAILVVGNVLLVSHIFMLNDWSGLTADAADPNKSTRVFTARGISQREIAAMTAGLLIASLLLFSRLGVMTLALAIGIAILSALYSLPRFNWKGRPLFNSAAHLAGGILHFLLGYSLGRVIDRRGVAIATFFALVFVAGHLMQEIRDHDGDAINSIRTNAVVFGPRRTFTAGLVVFALAHVILFTLALTGILPRALMALVALFALQLHWSLTALRDGLTYASMSRLQTRYRVLYALIGMAIVASLYSGAITVRGARATPGGHPRAWRSSAAAPTTHRPTRAAARGSRRAAHD